MLLEFLYNEAIRWRNNTEELFRPFHFLLRYLLRKCSLVQNTTILYINLVEIFISNYITSLDVFLHQKLLLVIQFRHRVATHRNL